MAYGGLRGAVGFSLVLLINQSTVPSAGENNVLNGHVWQAFTPPPFMIHSALKNKKILILSNVDAKKNFV